MADLFDQWDKLPEKVLNVFDKHLEEGDEDSPTFEQYQKIEAELNVLGYTCEYGMDAGIYGLKQIKQNV